MDPAIQAALRLGLALLLLGAVRHKVGDLTRFRAAVSDYRMLPAWATNAGAALLLAAELGVGVALLVPGTGGAAALLTLYSFAIGVNLLQGRRTSTAAARGPARAAPSARGCSRATAR